MRQITATGQTVEAAVQSALRQLNITADQAEVDIIDEGRKGLLGLFGSKPAIVKVSKVESPATKSSDIEEQTSISTSVDAVEQTKRYVEQIIAEFQIDVTTHVSVDKNVVTIDLAGPQIALLIGKRGQTLNAIQYLAQLAMHQYSEQYYTVIIDAEGYRERRNSTLVSLAKRLADRAAKTNKQVKIEPMPSYERKIIHTALQQRKDIETDSQGIEPNRYVVIKPKVK
ncbi:RNA-binding cell elongation regulator Jag/EloR [Gracilibacillus sp. S3-1-1]|uniref:RNA-binding cell elongation regulator Jag/EloR n=1 Tax=Gracilibacillus pellucidus TaxID=3095368 RepID=A0ACC6M3C9_9BACI|nr:RNA-binding cell elongation regulator Jag/EloR [Gracilibacillus sp. S3-1-1]MDX8045464.1 RNA-binding cell elongation regulator Jag/EloR [Gracilibacillus sp. S3-1-1]